MYWPVVDWILFCVWTYLCYCEVLPHVLNIFWWSSVKIETHKNLYTNINNELKFVSLYEDAAH
jgi:hypothetical protein